MAQIPNTASPSTSAASVAAVLPEKLLDVSQYNVTKVEDLINVPPDDRDRVWFHKFYQGTTIPQLTPRAVAMGMVLGSIMSLSNLYVGLKTGWGLGVAITSCILSYALWNAFIKMGIAKNEMSILENNCMQSTASSAGYSTGGTMVSAIAAYLMITGQQMPFWVLFFWTAFLALLGVCMAVPMKRQMINTEQLKFPSGIAAAETLRSLHAAGNEAMLKAKSLFLSMGIGAFIKWFIEGMPALLAKMGMEDKAKYLSIPYELPLPIHINGKEGEKYGLGLPTDPVMIAAGAITGLRTGLSMAFGAVILFGIIGPILDNQHIFAEMKALGAIASDTVSPGNIRKWGLWTGSAMMVSAGLTSFALQWRSIARALGGFTSLFSSKKDEKKDELAEIEVPNSWFAIGTVVAAIGCIIIMQTQWGVQWYWGIFAVIMSFFLSLVACRATGETDTTPIGAMGKVTQLFYGVAIPSNTVANLMTAGVTAGAAGSSADLLTDLKSGYLLGANPRQQFIAQAWGIIAGTIVVVPVWYVLVPDAKAIGAESKMFPAPAAEVWASVANLLSKGLASIHPTILNGIIAGALIGIILTLLDAFLPKEVKKWLPSATGIGLAFVINFTDSMAFLIGALLAYAYEKRNPEKADLYVVPVSSGIIAGGSILGIVIALLGAAGIL